MVGRLSDRTVTAAQWRFASGAVEGTMRFGIGVLLARLLPPAAFGLVGLVMVVVTFVTLVANVGLGQAVIQRQPLDDRHLRTASTAAVLSGVAVAALLALSAPLSARLLGRAEAPAVLRAFALLFVFRGFGVTATSLLQRALDFRRLFYLDVASFALGYAVVSVALALLGLGVWSLVWGAVAQQFVASALAVAVVRPPSRPLLARRELRELLSFGAGITANGVVNFMARYGDNFIVGRWAGPAALGLYSRAYNLMTLPQVYWSGVITKVLFPAFAEIRSETVRLRGAYLMSVQLTAMIAAPAMAVMLASAPHLIRTLYGERWMGVVTPLQIFCAAGLLRAVYHLGGSVAQASGNVYAELRRQALYALLVLVGAGVGVSFGLGGVAIGASIAIGVMYIAMAHLTCRITECAWGAFLSAQLPGVMLGGIVGASALAVRLLLEARAAPSPLIFAAILAVALTAWPLAIYALPGPIRPTELFARLGGPIAHLPVPLRRAAGRMLRLAD